MSAIPGEIETAKQPPMTVPLRHFLVAGGFLLLGVTAAIGAAAGLNPALSLVQVHLLLAGWVCLTIMGAMTQFVPVWSGTQLHSATLAAGQLWLVVAGLLGFVTGLLTNTTTLLPVAGATMLLGFWTFVYNTGRTLATVDSLDVTERHFAVALGFFLLVTMLGLLLAVGFVHPLSSWLPVTRPDLVATHATLAVFGAVLTTVVGALYQLSTMFTQTELHGIDIPLRRVEEIAYPVGVLLLAAGRLVGVRPLAALGGVLVAGSLLAVSVVLARRLRETRVDWTPMLSRYAVLAAAMALWAILALRQWVTDPLASDAVFGAPGTFYLLLLGVVGFVVLGTLYHVVPFIVWVHRYSDRLGYEPVPMIDDLYDDRVARADFGCFLGGTGLLVLADFADLPVAVIGGFLLFLGAVLFLANLLWVVCEHSPDPLLTVLFGGGRDENKQRTKHADSD
jgi:hypothetical protein